MGLLFNAAPGTITIESIRRGLNGGFMSAFAVQIGSLVGDALWVILGLFGAATLISVPFIRFPLEICGVALLGYLAMESFKDGLQPVPTTFEKQSIVENRKSLYAGIALSISNPMNITYWAALGGAISTLVGETATTGHFVIFISGFMLSSILWCFIAAWVIAVTRSHLSEFLWKCLHFGCGLGMLGFMLVLIYKLSYQPGSL